MPRASGPLLAAWAIFAAYFLAARGIRNAFPISVFDMYQARGSTTAARVVVLDEHGEQHELDVFGAVQCAAPPSLTEALRTCSALHRPLDYVVRDQQQLLEARRVSAPQPEAVAIVSRAWTFGAATTIDDCVLARCTARRGDDR